MFASAVQAHGGMSRVLGAGALGAIVLAGCGGGEPQDKHEKSGTYKVAIVRHVFPPAQALAQGERMTIVVRNDDSKAVPNVAVTVESFARAIAQTGVADVNRPVWIVDSEPRGTATAYTSTWASNRPLAPGRSRTFTWRVTPVVPGVHTLRYRVAAGLNGKAKARLADGGVPEGSFTVRISKQAPVATVDPKTGEVVRETSGGSSR
jgi:hypothetical protein